MISAIHILFLFIKFLGALCENRSYSFTNTLSVNNSSFIFGSDTLGIIG